MATSDAPRKATEQEVDRVTATLGQIEGLDTQSRAALASDLEKVPPSLQPLILSQLEAAAQRRQQKEADKKAEPATASSTPARIVSQGTKAEAEQPATVEKKQDAEIKPATYAEDEEAAIPAEPPARAARRDTSPFDRLAALARADDRKPAAEQRIAPAAEQRIPPPVEERSDAKVANRGTAIRSTTGPKSSRLEPADSRSWQDALDETLEKLEASLPSEAGSPDDVADLARLRLLYLAAGKRSEALEPIPGLSEETDAFFTKTLFGIDIWLDNRRISEEDRRAAAALPHLKEAIGNLGEVAPLSVRNLQFCTAVHSFGVIEPFKTDSFRPGQEVLVYAEVENFHSEETAEGFETILQGSILVFDSRGRRVAEIDLPKKEDRCNRRRNDFFLVYQVQLPERLYPGSHSLKLTIEDAGCRKIGQSTLKFAVSDKTE